MNNARMSLYAVLACIPAAFAQQIAQQGNVGQVAAGQLKEARVSWWGFDKDDSTAALKAAINSKAPKIIVDKTATPWITAETLAIPSDKEIVFEDGAVLEAKRGCFLGQGDCLVQVLFNKNVTLRGEGKGATLKMHKKDYHQPPYVKSEWRHCISLLSCSDVTIQNLTLLESGGDGIYFGIRDIKRQPTNITVRDVVCDGNNRQGISVIAGINCLVENTKMINTWGTPPAAGIDFEPNRPGEIINNFVMRNCESYNNQGAGYEFAIYHIDSTCSPLGITLDNCTSRNEGTSPINFYVPSGTGYDLNGYVTVKNCTFSDCPSPVIFKGNGANSFKTTFENVTIKNVSQKDEKINPILVGFTPKSQDAAGNLHFKNVTVIDNKERQLITFQDDGPVGGLKNVSGAIKHVVNGKTSTLKLTDKWAQKNYPSRKFPKITPFDMAGVTFTSAMPGATAQDLGDLKLRTRGDILFCVKAGDTLKFTLEYLHLGNYRPDAADVAIVSPSGKRTRLPSCKLDTTEDYELKNLDETGLYKVSVAAWQCIFALRKSNLPCAALNHPSPIDLCMAETDAFFYVPKGTPIFGVMLQGEGTEGIKAAVLDPDGKQLWEQDDITKMTHYFCEGKPAMKGGIFTLRLKKATHAPLEDFKVRILGVPALLSPARELVMKPVEK